MVRNSFRYGQSIFYCIFLDLHKILQLTVCCPLFGYDLEKPPNLLRLDTERVQFRDMDSLLLGERFPEPLNDLVLVCLCIFVEYFEGCIADAESQVFQVDEGYLFDLVEVKDHEPEFDLLFERRVSRVHDQSTEQL